MVDRSVQSKPKMGLLLYDLSKFTSTLKEEAVHSSGTLVPIYQTTVSQPRRQRTINFDSEFYTQYQLLMHHSIFLGSITIKYKVPT